MKPAILFFLVVFFPVAFGAESLDEAVEQVSERIAASREGAKKPLRVAVMAFTLPDRRTTQISQVIMGEIAGQLVNSGADRFILTERGQLETILNELLIGEEMIFDQARVKKIGKLAGAESLVVGELTPERDRVRMNARLIAVEDSRVLAQASAWFPLTPTVQTHLEKPYVGISFRPGGGGAPDPRSGTWIGQGICGEHKFGVALSMVIDPNDQVRALQSFYPYTQDEFSPGLIAMKGTYDESTDTVSLSPEEWIYQPQGSVAMGIKGTIDKGQGTFEGNYDHEVCSKVSLRRR